MRKISLSKNAVSKRISKIGKDQSEQLILRIKESRKFTIQLDELTDKVPRTSLLNSRKSLLIHLFESKLQLEFSENSFTLFGLALERNIHHYLTQQ